MTLTNEDYGTLYRLGVALAKGDALAAEAAEYICMAVNGVEASLIRMEIFEGLRNYASGTHACSDMMSDVEEWVRILTSRRDNTA